MDLKESKEKTQINVNEPKLFFIFGASISVILFFIALFSDSNSSVGRY